MRVIAGKYRSLRLSAPAGGAVRPAMDHIREYVFNVICSRVPQAEVCDLFAGTGSLGIEALSRGAKRTVFVDTSPSALASIRDNISRLRVAEPCEVLRADAWSYLERARAERRRFDLIFCDPPYGYPRTAELVAAILGGGVLGEKGVLVVEHDDSQPLILPEKSPLTLRDKKFGRTRISIFTAPDPV